ncbi:uncharacterized protein LOC116247836 isoform X2 [Nymphaea colorata]|nr:uncharacterized protein LOC116247358 isoform X2 [Nymphaea colorata]XP_031476054.1 uncharacterized protein LOC116247836 isoform X2 [Nymphaea colorata]
MTANTTNFEYWMHWQVFLCAIWILLAMFVASVLILKYDASYKLRGREADSDGQMDDCLYADESWRPCLKEIHPASLLIFRVVAFCLMASLLSINIILDGADMFYFYTQWTFTLVTVYFGLGSVLSMYGCYLTLKKGGNDADRFKVDTERGSYVPPVRGCNGSMAANSNHGERNTREKAGIWGHIFQVMFQTSAGAVMLTDCVFWFIIFPFLTVRDYSLNFFMVSMHSINAVLLLIDTSVNCMRFPWYRIAYFMLWTSVYVIFQWVIHASVSLWWPYPFLDLSSSWAPLWYLFVGLLHIPCYALFSFIIKAKHYFFARWFPQSYQCSK